MNPSCSHQDHEGEEYRSFTHSEEDNYPLHEICMLRRVSSVCLEHRRGEERRSFLSDSNDGSVPLHDLVQNSVRTFHCICIEREEHRAIQINRTVGERSYSYFEICKLH